MGATILRWFRRDGVRYRAYFRSLENGNGRALVVACGSRSHAVPAAADARLDDLSEAELFALADVLDGAAAAAALASHA